MRRVQILISIASLFLSLGGYASAGAQAPGYAEIVAPGPGDAVQGLMTIQGSASHPLFVSYDLAFTFQDAPLTTWFEIVENRELEVVDGRLGLWDTNGIADGEYQLRLRVHLENGTTLEDIIEGVRVRNTSTVETPTPAAVGAVAATETPPAATPTSMPTPIILPDPPGGSSVLQAFQYGLIGGAAVTLALGIYLFVRRRVRVRWGVLRMRRMLWQDERRKRRGS